MVQVKVPTSSPGLTTIVTFLIIFSIKHCAYGGCICTMEYAPVCGPNGVTYDNKCFADCSKVPESKLTPGACPADPLPITCDKGSPVAKCKGNPCDQPSPCKGRPDLRCIPNSCGRATYYGTKLSGATGMCKGVYVTTKAPFQVVISCKPAEPLPITCNKGSPVAKCKGNPCDQPSPCKGHPDLRCIPNSCGKATYYGTKLSGPTGMCKGVYVTKSTPFKVVTNCNKELPPLTCARGSPMATCARDANCEAGNSPCKGNTKYVCIQSYCSQATYLGTKLNDYLCKNIFVDPITRKVVTKCLSG